MTLTSLWPRWMFILRQRLAQTDTTRDSKIHKQEELLAINERIHHRNDGVEPILESLGLYAVEITTQILSPFMFFFFFFFSKETNVSELYGVRKNEILYYALFSMSMIFWKTLVNILTINSQELIYGWKVYDYLSYSVCSLILHK